MNLFKSILFFCLSALSTLGFAGEIKPYSQTEFDKLTASGKGVVLAIHAPWCPTCKAQAPIQSELIKRNYWQISKSLCKAPSLRSKVAKK